MRLSHRRPRSSYVDGVAASLMSFDYKCIPPLPMPYATWWMILLCNGCRSSRLEEFRYRWIKSIAGDAVFATAGWRKHIELEVFVAATADYTLLCFSSTDWDGIWGSRQQVMSRFARRGYRVLFVEQPAGLEHLLRYPALHRRKLRRWREGLRQVEDNLWIVSMPPLLPGRYYSPIINLVNQWLTARLTAR